MSPDSKLTDHALGIWWRRWAGSIALVSLVIGGTIGFIKVDNNQDDTNQVAKESAKTASKLADIVDRLDQEGQKRERQFCELVLGSYEDRVHRVETTEAFLSSPAGEESTVFNEYIREISLPQTVVEVEKERQGLPGICWKYQDAEK